MILTCLILATIATGALTIRSLQIRKRYRFSAIADVGPGQPTVSVCIAARNETHALATCLERILKSEYQKLEILVLDDSSTDDTSLIIKSFAGAGVRFIPGTSLPTGWLGKNHAYQTLIQEASGDLILFLDVDTTVKPKTISQLVDRMQSSGVSMISILPQRSDLEHASAIFNTLRYHWELLLGTRNNPPAASAAWMVRSDLLQGTAVDLTEYASSVRPERHFARKFNRLGAYRYYIASSQLGLGFEKRLKSQWETAERLYYPMTSRSPVGWAASTVFLISILLPFALLIIWPRDIRILNWVCWLLVINTFSLSLVFRRIHAPGVWRLRVFVWPVLICQEIVLNLLSFMKYSTNTVTWKGRRVGAQPVVHDRIELNE